MKRFVRRVFVKQRRQSASIGAAVMGVLLLAGAALGTGIARTAVAVSDGLTWLGDDQRGELVQVNPASGRPEIRLAVAGGDAQLDIIQRDGALVVLDRRTGQITVIDLATLLASGRRQAAPGTTSKVLLAANKLFIVDRATGTIVNADPVTLADVGEPWTAGQPLADAVVDEDGLVWAASADGVLHTLEWDASRFLERANRAVPGAGPRTVLVPHGKGVTLLGLEGGVVLQDGTGRDHSASTDPRDGDVLAAQTSPDDLVPAAVPGSGVVVILSDDQVHSVDVSRLGCPKPGRPAVFHGRVYVPCLGSGKVIVLGPDGERGGEDVRTGGRDPQLVFDDDRLFIQTPGGETGIVVDPDGDTSSVRVRDPELPVTDPERDPPPTPPSPPKPDPDEPTRTRPILPPPPTRPGNGNGVNTPPVTTVPVSTTTVSVPPSGPGAPGQPAGITAAQVGRTDTQVTLRISWTAPADTTAVAGYTITANGASKQTGGTSDELTFDCGAICATGGPVDIQVAAYSATAVGTAAVTTWTLPARPAPTTTPPLVTTTTQRPTTTTPPPVTTTTTPPPPPTTTTPPPPQLPSAGAAIITGATGVLTSYQRTLSLAPPADWAGHSGSCEVVNRTWGDSGQPIACSATSVQVYVEDGTNSFVVRAHAPDGSGYVDSAARSVFKRIQEPNPCDNQRPPCQIPRAIESEPAAQEAQTGVMVGAGLGLLLTSALLRARRREERE
jgi:hypothetical protein